MLHVRAETGGDYFGGGLRRHFPPGRPEGEEPEASRTHHHGGSQVLIFLVRSWSFFSAVPLPDASARTSEGPLNGPG